MTRIIAQVLDDPDAAAYLRWLDWAYWLVLVICIAAVIAGIAKAGEKCVVREGDTGRAIEAAVQLFE